MLKCFCKTFVHREI